jgi:hypothetical protein
MELQKKGRATSLCQAPAEDLRDFTRGSRGILGKVKPGSQIQLTNIG